MVEIKQQLLQLETTCFLQVTQSVELLKSNLTPGFLLYVCLYLETINLLNQIMLFYLIIFLRQLG